MPVRGDNGYRFEAEFLENLRKLMAHIWHPRIDHDTLSALSAGNDPAVGGKHGGCK
jgi:hypothetical protein